MKLNWRKIFWIVVCAELLFMYWNTLETLSFRKQQAHTTKNMVPAAPPVSQFHPATTPLAPTWDAATLQPAQHS
ncbi:hypothetical protein [Paenibacillus whitsoniae]|uniref:Uncharacterized protein n=1 Tax=Paenibacillus whitsoniae TaxID=2496558 RepID=A0A430JGC8_9BACL|nr:hypothetical protein [Paenibacillus whitsoniae]RTE10078.1 hypothetical protein EJQ19_09375 [Paenibacillus whitsoniae]